jgi:hypothetical protein
MHDAADFFEDVAQIMRGRGRGRDRIHGADFHARGDHAQRQRRVAVHHYLRLAGSRGGNRVFQVEVFLGPVAPGVEQFDIGVDDLLVLLGEDEAHLIPRHPGVEGVDAAQHAQREHVLAAPRVGHIFHALRFHRDLIEPIPRGPDLLAHPRVFGGDGLVPVVAPHAFQQNDAARLDLARAHAAEQNLFIEGDHQIGFVTAIGDPMRGQADTIAAGPGDAARRRLDFGGDDLDGPDAVPHPCRNGPE